MKRYVLLMLVVVVGLSFTGIGFAGDKDAIKVLKEAQTNFYTYNTILLNGMKRGNNTLKIALLILSGEIDGKAIPEDMDHDIDEAMEKMEAKLFPMNVKNQR